MKSIYKLFILLLLFPISSLCQTKNYTILTDTSMAVGIIGEAEFVGKSVGEYCLLSNYKYIRTGTAVLISGVKNCHFARNTEFFEIIYNNQTYFINKEKLVTESSVYYQIQAMSSGLADSFRTNAQMFGQLLYDGNKNRLLRFIEGCKSKGLAVLDWSYYDESEYTDGTSVNIEVYNPTSKTIKYLWFTFVGLNPVGDKVIDRRRGGANITMKGVGPIEPNESGTYKYTYFWFTDLVETASQCYTG